MSVQYQSTRDFESTTHPGVKFTTYKMSEKRRSELFRSLATVKERERELQRAFADIDARRVLVTNEDGTPKMNTATGEQEKRYASPTDELAVTHLMADLDEFRQSDVYPAYIKSCLKAIEGMDIDGQPITVDLLLEAGPIDLTEEILAAIQGRVELSAEKKTS